jgi:hypothetical protein
MDETGDINRPEKARSKFVVSSRRTTIERHYQNTQTCFPFSIFLRSHWCRICTMAPMRVLVQRVLGAMDHPCHPVRSDKIGRKEWPVIVRPKKKIDSNAITGRLGDMNWQMNDILWAFRKIESDNYLCENPANDSAVGKVSHYFMKSDCSLSPLFYSAPLTRRDRINALRLYHLESLSEQQIGHITSFAIHSVNTGWITQ